MSASQTVPGASNLHSSIEQLIAETVRKSQTTHEEELQKLTAALQAALGEIETGQQALNRAADTLRSALGGESAIIATEPAPAPATDREEEAAIAINAPAVEPVASVSDHGPHELNVIAHDASIGNASGLQTLLRSRPEVSTAQTREFVNGELRLQLSLTSGLDMASLGAWLGEHGGNIVSSTDSVIEIRFGAVA